MQSRDSRKQWLGIGILFILGAGGLATLSAPAFGERYVKTVLSNYLIPSILTGIAVAGVGYWLSNRREKTT